jgi:peptide/nickel transport system ATP-binding protein
VLASGFGGSQSMSITLATQSSSTPFLSVRDLVVDFDLARGRKLRAVAGVSFDVTRGKTLGLVGESGCGKSSMARALLMLPRPNSGSVRLGGIELTMLGSQALRQMRRHVQMIFQDPVASLNPRRRVADIVGDPLAILGEGNAEQRRTRVLEMLDAVGLSGDGVIYRRPHEFSGGQCQRISIARALILNPELLICDEAVSSLDVSVQAQILNLLEDLKQKLGLTVLFISHNLAVVKHVSDRVAVMYLGRICEVASAKALYERPKHPYTRALLAAVPEPDPDRRMSPTKPMRGELPSPVDPPSGCRFRTRCPFAQDRCVHEEPKLSNVALDQQVACHFPD